MGDMIINQPTAHIQNFYNLSSSEQTQVREAITEIVKALREQIPETAKSEVFEKRFAELEAEAKTDNPSGEKVGTLLGRVGDMFDAVGKPVGKIVTALKGAGALVAWLGQHWPF